MSKLSKLWPHRNILQQPQQMPPQPKPPSKITDPVGIRYHNNSRDIPTKCALCNGNHSTDYHGC